MDEKKRGGRGIFRFFLLVLLAILVIGLIANRERFTPDRIRRALSYFGAESTWTRTFEFSSDTKSSYLFYEDGLAVLSQGALTVIGPENREELYIQRSFQRPALCGNDTSLIAYDIGGTALYIVDGYNVINDGQAPGPVIHCDMNAAGWSTVVAEEGGAKATATVYDASMDIAYKWFSSERYLLSATVSPDCTRMAVAGLSQKNARICSTLLFFRLDSTEVSATYEILDDLVLDMKYVADDRVAVLTESDLILLSGEGELLAKFAYTSTSLRGYDLSEEGMTLVLDEGLESEVRLYDVEGIPVGTFRASGVIAASVKGDYIGILTNDLVIVYNKDGRKLGEISVTPGGRTVIQREDGAVLLVYPTRAELLEL
ncbi:DUF5711 family protein [Oscillospiraceae bacterium OttesenSCG-928-F05]|nr:DUF5711 family protein [Oscillospiraceae bacterium OttesenSCG-928-F05]